MSDVTVEEIYKRHVKPLPPADRLRLLALTAQELAEQPAEPEEKPKRSIMELHGLGAHIWEGVDAQEYVNELRQEWDHRP
ncbi:MAG: hypothetical protein M3347_13130 [Armatimonadota bacterium]|nr:hypothetical protein [Armatimonadota bacterium]